MILFIKLMKLSYVISLKCFFDDSYTMSTLTINLILLENKHLLFLTVVETRLTKVLLSLCIV